MILQTTMNRKEGFTLIELMIVVAIIGIISAIAYPSYTEYIKNGQRAEVKSEIENIAQRIEARKIAYKRYSAIPLSELGFSNSGTKDFPNSAKKKYELTISNSSNNLANNWVIEAEPTNTMSGDGKIKINSTGHKCWDGDGDCDLSASSSWDK